MKLKLERDYWGVYDEDSTVLGHLWSNTNLGPESVDLIGYFYPLYFPVGLLLLECKHMGWPITLEY